MLIILWIFVACAHQGTNYRELASIQRKQAVKLWKNSLEETHKPGIKLSSTRLQNLYLASIDEEDFVEHLLLLNPAGSLEKKEDYFELSKQFMALQKQLLSQLPTTKSQSLSTLLVILAEKVEESRQNKFGK
ncbi:MAG: hypothetical protein ACOYL6_09450 [Bacteriovoracaceae bacterium]